MERDTTPLRSQPIYLQHSVGSKTLFPPSSQLTAVYSEEAVPHTEDQSLQFPPLAVHEVFLKH